MVTALGGRAGDFLEDGKSGGGCYGPGMRDSHRWNDLIDVSPSSQSNTASLSATLAYLPSIQQRNPLFPTRHRQPHPIRFPLDPLDPQPPQSIIEVIAMIRPETVAISRIHLRFISHTRSIPQRKPPAIGTPLDALRVECVARPALDHGPRFACI